MCTPGSRLDASLSRNMADCTMMIAVALYAGSGPLTRVTISRSGSELDAAAASAAQSASQGM